MNVKNTLSKIFSVSGFIAAMVGFILLKMFLDGKIIDIPKDTSEGRIITIVGYVAIIITIPLVTLVIQLLIKRKSKK